MNPLHRLPAVLLLASLLVSPVSAQTQLLRIHGSNTVGAKLMPALVHAWLKEKNYRVVAEKQLRDEEKVIEAKDSHGNQLTIELHAHGSSTSFRDLAAEKADLGMSSRPIKLQEITRLASRGKMDSPRSEYVIALDGLAILVHKSNPLKSIDKRTLQKIFSGEITDWKQLGLSRAPIHVYVRDDKSGTYDTFKSLVLGKKMSLVSTAKRYESNAHLSDDVATDPLGIGFTGLAYVRNAKVLAVSEPGADPLMPTAFNVGTEDYALARRLFVYLPEYPDMPVAKSLAEFAAGQKAQTITAAQGFISQNIESDEYSLNDAVPEEYRQLTKGAKRLSLNIRFQKGLTSLDNKAVRDVERLINFMKQPQNQAKKVMLFGFADRSEIGPYASLAFSIERADAVADYMIRQKLAPLRVRGYGHALSVADNQSEKGRHKNRRVEVWIK